MNKILNTIKYGELKVDRQDRLEWPRFSDEDRLKLYRRCGDKCFMLATGTPQEILANPKKTLKFPVCRVPPKKDKCKLSASGLLACNRRARLTKKYPQLVKETSKMIQELGITAKSRKQMNVDSVRIKTNPQDASTFIVSVVYENGIRETLTKPLTVRMIKNRFNDILSPSQKKKLGLVSSS
jgi:hypothetical protein